MQVDQVGGGRVAEVLDERLARLILISGPDQRFEIVGASGAHRLEDSPRRASEHERHQGHQVAALVSRPNMGVLPSMEVTEPRGLPLPGLERRGGKGLRLKLLPRLLGSIRPSRVGFDFRPQHVGIIVGLAEFCGRGACSGSFGASDDETFAQWLEALSGASA
ncbi:MAG: hypothetical protein UZ18_ATM001000963 [Armatimonadetes bacterium OLB18]|nr:MAG: hypothetical protein UZ18_ATM001000963 [Armatimonadetes bacterium OLB18]